MALTIPTLLINYSWSLIITFFKKYTYTYLGTSTFIPIVDIDFTQNIGMEFLFSDDLQNVIDLPPVPEQRVSPAEVAEALAEFRQHPPLQLP